MHCIINGRHVSLEIKISNDKLSDHQVKEIHRVTDAGGIYFIAPDMQSFVDWYKETFKDEKPTSIIH